MILVMSPVVCLLFSYRNEYMRKMSEDDFREESVQMRVKDIGGVIMAWGEV